VSFAEKALKGVSCHAQAESLALTRNAAWRGLIRAHDYQAMIQNQFEMLL